MSALTDRIDPYTMHGHDPILRPPTAADALNLALAEERGLLIVALYEMPMDALERLVDAAQLIDAEGVEALELRDHAADVLEEEEAA